MTLQSEIIKQIFKNIGLVPGPNFGKVGIADKNLIVSKKLILEDEDNQRSEYNLYSGIQYLGNSVMHGLAVCLSEDEFIIVFKLNTMPTHGLKYDYSNDQLGAFLVNYEKDTWNQASIFTQASTLAGIEQITDQGIMWEPYNNYVGLYDSLVSLLDK